MRQADQRTETLMARALLSNLFILLSCAAVASPAYSSVAGEWRLRGTLTSIVRVDGSTRLKSVEEASDRFLFRADGTFEMIGMQGRWRQNEASFTVYLDPLAVENYFEAAFAEEGVKAVAKATKIVFKGIENGDGTMSGGFLFKMIIYFLDSGLEGEIHSELRFTGTRSARAARFEEITPLRPRRSFAPI